MPRYFSYYMGLLSDKPKKLCTSGTLYEKGEDGKETWSGTPCNKPLVAIPYKRRDVDVKTLNVLICPSCDGYDKWPRENVE